MVAIALRIVAIGEMQYVRRQRFFLQVEPLDFCLSQNWGEAKAPRMFLRSVVMGAVVIAVVFVAGLIGVPTFFKHGDAHAQEQQVASVQTPAPSEAANGAPAATDHP